MAVSDQATSLLSLTQRQLDRVVSPSTRRETYDRALDLAATRPGAFVRFEALVLPSTSSLLRTYPIPPVLSTPAKVYQSFLALLIALSLPPILVFTTFFLSTLLLTLGTAILFTLFWTGVALLLLVPALFFAAGCAVFLWSWAVGSFIVARWLAKRTGFDFGFGMGKDGNASQEKVVKVEAGRNKTGLLGGEEKNGVYGVEVYKKEADTPVVDPEL